MAYPLVVFVAMNGREAWKMMLGAGHLCADKDQECE